MNQIRSYVLYIVLQTVSIYLSNLFIYIIYLCLEVMLSSAITGMIWSIIAGQPLVIVGVTGPVTILTISIYTMAKNWDINFISFYAWAQMWASLMHITLACVNFCDVIVLITRFSCEIFGCLIAIIYLYTGFSGVADKFGNSEDFEGALFQLLIALGTAWLAIQLSQARHWIMFNEETRELVSDYGPTCALILWSFVPYMGSIAKGVDIETLDLPTQFETTSRRPWLADLTDLPVWAVFAAILPGFITTVLFFFDHNVSSLLAQEAEFKLKKPPAFHWDFFVLGLTIFATGILGIPPTNGLIPQAPLHTKSLTVLRSVHLPEGGGHDEIVRVHEQRGSNFMQAFLIGCMCFYPFLGVLTLVPNSALDGLFIFMGYSSFGGNQFAERFKLIFTEPRFRESKLPFFKTVSFDVQCQFTYIQAVIVVVIFGVTLTPAAMVFPVLIGVLIPFRTFFLPKYMSDKDLDELDPQEDSTTFPELGANADPILRYPHQEMEEEEKDGNVQMVAVDGVKKYDSIPKNDDDGNKGENGDSGEHEDIIISVANEDEEANV
jgi:hypothetical protein